MALDLNNLMLRLQPVQPIGNLGLGSASETEYQRQNLALMRQKFEEEKRKNQAEEEYQRLAEATKVKQAELALQKQQQEDQAKAQAANVLARQGSLDEMLKAQGSGDYEGMESRATQLNALGGYANRLGESGGFPAWQVGVNAPAQPPPGLNPLDALGYQATGARDALNETAPEMANPLSTEDAFSKAQNATRYAEDTGGQAIRGPDTPDAMGGVPSDVIDTGAMQMQRQQRLGPAMAGIAQSYPEPYRESMGQANDAISGLGLPVDKALERSASVRSEVGGAIDKERAHQFKLEEDQAKLAAAEQDPRKRQQLIKYGDTYARNAYKDQKIQSRIDNMQAAGLISQMLNNGDPQDDEKVVNYLMKLDAQVGSQTDRDANRMTGLDKASAIQRLRAWVYQGVHGGFDPTTRKSVLDFVEHVRANERDNVFSYIDDMHRRADENPDRLVGEGYRQFVNGMPRWVLEEFDKENPPEEEGAPEKQGSAASPKATPTSYEPGAVDPNDDFRETLAAESAAAGVDENKILKVIGPESGGNPQAVNKSSGASGLGQFMDSTARRYQNPRTGKNFSGAAEYGQLSGPEQVPALVQYFKDSGVTEDSPVEDYALALAAPAFVGKSKDRNTVVYKKGSEAWKLNPAWHPPGGGDITVGSITDFYTRGQKKDEPEGGPGDDDDELLEGIE